MDHDVWGRCAGVVNLLRRNWMELNECRGSGLVL